MARRMVKSARDKLKHAIDERFKPALRKLFGRDLTPNDARRLDGQLEKIEKRLEASPEENVHISTATHAGGWAERGVPGGYIYLTQSSIEDTRRDLAEVIIHEASHSEANTADHWYVHPNLSRYANFYAGTSYEETIDFDKAMDNADTIKHAASILSDDVTPSTPAEEAMRRDALRMARAIERELLRPWTPETTRAMESLFNKHPLTDEDRQLMARNFRDHVEDNLQIEELIDGTSLDLNTVKLPRRDRAKALLDWAIRQDATREPVPRDFESATRRPEYQQKMADLMLANRTSRQAQPRPPEQVHSMTGADSAPSPGPEVQPSRRAANDMAGFDAFIRTHPTPEAFRARYPDIQLARFGEGFVPAPGKDVYVARDVDGRLGPGYFAVRA